MGENLATNKREYAAGRGWPLLPLGPRESNGYPDNLKILASGDPEAAKRLAPGRGFSYIIQLICIPSSLSFM